MRKLLFVPDKRPPEPKNYIERRDHPLSKFESITCWAESDGPTSISVGITRGAIRVKSKKEFESHFTLNLTVDHEALIINDRKSGGIILNVPGARQTYGILPGYFATLWQSTVLRIEQLEDDRIK